MSKIDNFKLELRDLLAKYKASLSVDVIGDTHGLMYDFEVTFIGDTGRYSDNLTVFLNKGYAHIDASDISIDL